MSLSFRWTRLVSFVWGMAIVGLAPSMSPGARGQTTVPVRPLTAGTTIVSPLNFGAVSQVRQLSDGRLLVHDATKRRVVLLDSALTSATVVIDSTTGQDNSYGTRPGGLLAYAGDSTLFLDATDGYFDVIDEHGKVVRIKAAPVSNLSTLGFPASEKPVVFDARRGFVLATPMPRPGPHDRPAPGMPDILRKIDDSLRVIVIDAKTRKADTIASLRLGPATLRLSGSGNAPSAKVIGVLPRVDDWAVMSDGTIVIARGQDYHLEFIAVDGTRSATPPLPMTWHRLNPLERRLIADSVSAARATETQKLQVQYDKDVADAAARGRAPDPEDVPFMPEPFAASEVPDTLPAFGRNATRADADGHLWIRINQPGAKPSDPDVYDIVDRAGMLIDRIEMPLGKVLVGFGQGGYVYLRSGAPGGVHLERVRMR